MIMKNFKIVIHVFLVSMLLSCTITPVEPNEENGNNIEIPADSLFKSVTSRGIKLEWRILQSFIEFRITAPTNGWIGVGFQRVEGDASDYDIVVGTVPFQGTAEIIDGFGSFANGFTDDIEQGGMDNIAESRGIIGQNERTIIFTRLLNTGDTFDMSLNPLGQYSVYLAYSNSENFGVGYSVISRVSITL